jgi:small nuclear ribonucleoprotein (snRNP)-like protein
MENSKGPLALLQKFVSNNRIVKVYIRKEHGIRGYIIGQLVFFDKHYNLALIECTETWKRRKYKFSDSNIPFPNPPQDCSKLLASMGIEVPQISVKSLNRKYVECTRKLNQIMIRGEDVILISEFTENQKVS